MDDHRCVAPVSLVDHDVRRPFSNFDFVEDRFSGCLAVRRLFSQARAFGGKTVVEEDIPPVGVVADENAEIRGRWHDYETGGLKRLSFWRSVRPQRGRPRFRSRDLLGYAILKQDTVGSRDVRRWHVFESVFVKYPHRHNCVHHAPVYPLRVGDEQFSVKGVLYCQQNGLNKACAQVALRTLCALHVPDTELPYSRINRLAANAEAEASGPEEGLTVPRIRAVLRGLGVGFRDVDYRGSPDDLREILPYQKYLYAGVESGAGALLGFRFSGPSAQGEHHIIPAFGHTFNQDTWVSNADAAYFHVGEQTRYVPSEAWLSSFIGHDDNFGSNFCVPRSYITPDQAEYVVELFHDGVCYSGVVAEAIAVDYLYSVLPSVAPRSHRWLCRLLGYALDQQVVLRAVAVTRRQYLRHYRAARDWGRGSERSDMLDVLKKHLPPRLWMVEVSVPELFPVNERKLGEIVLDATRPIGEQFDFSLFLLARFPGQILVLEEIEPDGGPQFVPIPSGLQSHTPVYSG